MNTVKIAYIGGGSMNWAWVLMKDLAVEREFGGEIYLYDIEYSAASANEYIGNKLFASQDNPNWKFVAVRTLEEALDGSTFIFVSILPLDFAEMRIDVHSPERYGLYQPVGDTTGPGGLMRAMRTVPMFAHIAQMIKSYAPNAWVINYTNPMSICTRTLYEVFPEIKAFGCCHEVFTTQKLLATIAEMAGFAPKGSIRREEVKTHVLGINHFTWIDQASWKDVDLLPLYADFVDRYHAEGYQDKDGNWMNNVFASANRVKMDLFRRFGIIAAAGDRHLAEFCPSSWYLQNPSLVEKWMFSLTSVDFRIEKRAGLRKKREAYLNGTESMEISDSGEEGIRIMKALLGLGDLITNVNLPNVGQCPDFTHGPVVETNALFRRDSIQPVFAGHMPKAISLMCSKHIYAQQGIVEASLERDLHKAKNIFANDLRVSELSPDAAEALFDEMARKTLPDYGQWSR